MQEAAEAKVATEDAAQHVEIATKHEQLAAERYERAVAMVDTPTHDGLRPVYMLATSDSFVFAHFFALRC